MRFLFLIIILIFCIPAYSQNSDSKITFSELKTKISCKPTLISRWIQEEGYGKYVDIFYGPWHLRRSDVGKPEGKLTLKKNNILICDINTDLNPDIYLSSKDMLLIISYYNGSTSGFTIYDLNRRCKKLGILTSDKENEQEYLNEINSYQEFLNGDIGLDSCKS